MRPRFDYGDEVRVTRNVRNDGTYPGMDIGAPLVRRGSVGYVQNVGTYLQDQIIYSVHFLEADRLVGCREEELISMDETWVPTRFEFRDKVAAARPLGIGGEVVAEPGAVGEVIRVLRDAPGGPAYHVHFPGRTLQVPEEALTEVPKDSPDAAEDEA
ncbi:MAG: nitrogen fixation protein NifZ [Gammaproteobacteria bacterium]|jgi:nitrogen fixation protein NifZ